MATGHPADAIARLLGVTPKQLQTMARNGIVPRATDGLYDLVAVVRAYIEHLNGQIAAQRGAGVSLVQAAALFGKNRNTIAKWIDQGCPVTRKADRSLGVEWELAIPAVIEWRIRKAVEDAIAPYEGHGGNVSYDEARRLKAVAEALVAEIEAQEAQGRVVDIPYATSKVAEKFIEVRTALTSVGAKIAGRAASISSAPAIQELVDQAIRESLEPLRDAKILGGPQPPPSV